MEGIELVCFLDCWLGAAVAVADGVEEGEDDAHLWLWWWWLVVCVALGAGWGEWGMTQVGCCMSWRMRRLN